MSVTDLAQRLEARLRSGLQAMQLTLDDTRVARLVEYVLLFDKWNRAYNLSAVRDPLQMVDRHLLDSLSVVPHVQPGRIIDVGSGGGLPGIPLAIVLEGAQLTLLDSNGKKTRFLFQVKTALGLDNVEVVHARVESHRPEQAYDAVISRAFASLDDMTRQCRHLLDSTGVFYAMKGVYPHDELSEMGKHYKVSAVHSLQVPREEGQRHLLVLDA